MNLHLPMIESEAEVTLRTPRVVADRLHALVFVAFKASENPDQALVETVIAERELRLSWRCEAAWVLLWALRYVDGRLGPPRDTCDVPYLSETVFETADLSARGLRSANDILNEADLIYRYHWAVRQSELDGADAPVGLHPGVTMERHHALNWLAGYEDLDWDDVTTDT